MMLRAVSRVAAAVFTFVLSPAYFCFAPRSSAIIRDSRRWMPTPGDLPRGVRRHHCPAAGAPETFLNAAGSASAWGLHRDRVKSSWRLC